MSADVQTSQDITLTRLQLPAAVYRWLTSLQINHRHKDIPALKELHLRIASTQRDVRRTVFVRENSLCHCESQRILKVQEDPLPH